MDRKEAAKEVKVPWHKQVPGIFWSIAGALFLSFIAGSFAVAKQGIKMQESIGTISRDVRDIEALLQTHLKEFRSHEKQEFHNGMMRIHQGDMASIQQEFKHQRELLLRIEAGIRNGQ